MMKFFRRFQDLGLAGAQAKLYDNNTRKHRLEEVKEEAREGAQYIKDGDPVLEVGSGPGYLSIELAKLGNYKITAMDISNDVLKIAGRNAEENGVEIDFRQGNASSLPFDDSMFELIICVLALKNLKNRLKL